MVSRPASERVAELPIDNTIVQNLTIDDVAARHTAKSTARILSRSTFPIPQVDRAHEPQAPVTSETHQIH